MATGRFGFHKIASGGLPVDPCLSLHISKPSVSPVYGAGIIAGYDANSLALAQGAGISSWSDSSGNGNTATKAVAAQRPLMDFVNGAPTVNFDSSTKGLDISGLSVNSSDYTFHVALRGALTDQGFQPILAAFSTHGGFAIEPNNAGTIESFFIEGNPTPVACTNPSTCRWHVISGVANSAGNVEVLYRNGNQVDIQSYTAQPEAFGNWIIGDFSGSGIGWIGRVVEVRAYNVAQSAATVLAEATAIRTRWGFP